MGIDMYVCVCACMCGSAMAGHRARSTGRMGLYEYIYLVSLVKEGENATGAR